VTPLASSSPTEVTETESEATQRLLLLTVLQNILSHTSDGIIVAFILQEAYERLDFFLNAREGDLRILRNQPRGQSHLCLPLPPTLVSGTPKQLEKLLLHHVLGD
jgi:hypothetical protein